MNLIDLKKRLYKRDNGIEGRPQSPQEFEAGHVNEPRPVQAAPSWQQPVGQSVLPGRRRSGIFWWLVLAVILLSLAAGGWWWWSGTAFSNRSVALDIFGEQRLVSGEETTYIVRYKNNTQADLNNAVLTFILSPQSLPLDPAAAIKQGILTVIKNDLGKIAAGQEGQAEFKVRVLGDKDSQQNFSAKLEYRPAGTSANFSNQAEFASMIISVPLVLNFVLPDKIVSGQTLNFSLKYLNTSEAVFSNTKLKIEYPDGFVFDSALPSPAEGDNLWNLPEIGSREEGKVMLKGTISGNEGDNKIFKAQIGTTREEGGEMVAFTQTVSSPQISASPLTIEQTAVGVENERVSPGSSLTYHIKYRNATTEEIGPIVVNVKIDSQAVDWSGVSASRGYFSSSERTITWNVSSVPALEKLAAGGEGELEFQLRVKDKLTVNNFSDKNFTIQTTAKVDSPNTPLGLTGTQLAGQHQLVLKVNSKLVLKAASYFNDPNRFFQNIGLLPPKVGQLTSYVIYWQLQNISNELSGVTLEGYLPSYVSWGNKIYPAGENVEYNSATGKITWKIGRLPAGTGVLLPVKQVAFQVNFLPSLNQVGNLVTILKNIKVSGEDNFTGAMIETTASDLKTDCPDDAGVGYGKGVVVN